MDQAALSSPYTQSLFASFGEWLIQTVGPKKAALTIHRYLNFFAELGQRWDHIPPYTELLAYFGAERLRRAKLPMQWLRETKSVEPDQTERENDSEYRRIKGILESIPQSSSAGRSLAAYKTHLDSRLAAGKISIRSVRLALSPAASLLKAADPIGNTLPDQKVLDGYLLASPGQKAAVTGFVNFLNRLHGTELVARVDEQKGQNAHRRKLERKLMELARNPAGDRDFIEQWVRVGLEYFHSVTMARKDLARVRINEGDDNVYRVEISDVTYTLPKVSSMG